MGAADADEAQRQRRRRAPKGRQPDAAVLAELQGWFGADAPRREHLIEALHVINDRLGALPAPHLVALAHGMRLAMAEVFEVAGFYHHFELLPDEGDVALPRR